MEISNIILGYLQVIVSWPVIALVILLSFKRELAGIVEKLSERIKSAEIGGQKLEFSGGLESQGKITKLIDEIQRGNPEIMKKSLEKTGIDENEIIEYRANIRSKVIQIQQSLKQLGYDLGKFGVDGIPGRATKKAIRQLQIDSGIIPDGIIGPQTLNKINELVRKHFK